MNFGLWPPLDIGNGIISGDVKRAHEALAKDWVLAYSELISVSFIDGSTLEKGGSWEVNGLSRRFSEFESDISDLSISEFIALATRICRTPLQT